MKKFIMRSSFALVMCCLLFAACRKDDNTDENTASVTGYWVCYYQCWSEDGETWESNYNGDDYYINFSSHLADGKYEGDIDSGSDQLLELMGHYSFAWTISGNKIKVALSDSWTEEWQVKSLKGDEMTLQWKDEEVDYTIIAKFKKQPE